MRSAIIVSFVICAVARGVFAAPAPVFDVQPNEHWQAELRVKSAELVEQRETIARKVDALGCKSFCDSLNTAFARIRKVAVYQMPESADHDWSLVITRLPDDKAWSLADGHVFISEAFLQHDKLDEDETAFVIAHEISHVALGHEADMVDIVRQLVPFGVSASVSDVYATLDYDMGLLLRISPMMFDMELEADRTGLLFAALAGYDPDRAIGFLRKLAAEAPRENLVATHPEGWQRLEAAEQFLPIARRLYAQHDALMAGSQAR